VSLVVRARVLRFSGLALLFPRGAHTPVARPVEQQTRQQAGHCLTDPEELRGSNLFSVCKLRLLTLVLLPPPIEEGARAGRKEEGAMAGREGVAAVTVCPHSSLCDVQPRTCVRVCVHVLSMCACMF
jgi:hypothetical protein